MKELRFTLYEVLGYVFPGTLTFGALFIALWCTRGHHLRTDLINQISRRDLAVLAIFVYTLGHLTQAIANWLERLLDKVLMTTRKNPLRAIARALERVFLEQDFDRQRQGTQPPVLMKKVRDEASDYFNIDASELSEKALVQLCDSAVMAAGPPEEREVYVYREGFYRGMWVGLVLVSLALLCPWIRQWSVGDIAVETLGRSLKPSVFGLGGLAMVSWICSCFAYCRYWRFRNYRIDSTFLFFLSVAKRRVS